MIAFTIVSRAYVPHARVLARSYAEHHPGTKMWALLIDDVDGEFEEADEPFHVLRLRDLDVDQDELHRMAMLFSSKLIAVIKPWIFEHFITRGADSVLYVDGDFVIFDSLDPVAAQAGTGVILVPHMLHPLPRDGKDPNETTMLGAGMFNAGMFGAGRDHGGFIEFMQERLRRECIFDPRVQRFNEQRWLDLVPPLFPHHIVRDPGMDAAYWNLHERPLEVRDGKWFVGGVPLRAFHFSSFDPRAPRRVGRFELSPNPRVSVDIVPALAELFAEYARQLAENGFSELHDTPFWFDTLSDGVPVYETTRDLYTAAVLSADRGDRAYPPDAFDAASRSALGEWLVDEYRVAGQTLPRRLSKQPESGTADPPGWALDWLGQMIVDPAAERVPGGIRVFPDRVGFICHGPRAVLSPGHYRIVLEWESHPAGDVADPDDDVLVVEAFSRGYVVGSRSATLTEIRRGEVPLDVLIPLDHLEEAVLFGVELRLLTRGGVDATLTGVIAEQVASDQVPRLEPLRVDWLPVMAGGAAGLRKGREIVTLRGQVGTVVAGPNWRLPTGRYRVDVGLRLRRPPSPRGGAVMVVEVAAGGRVLAGVSMTERDVARGHVRVEFGVSDDIAGTDDQIGVQVRSNVPLRAAVTEVRIEQLTMRDGGVAGVA